MVRSKPIPTARSRSLAAYLRDKRLRAGLSYAAAAAATDLAETTIRRAEDPATCRPHHNNVKAMLQAYRVHDPAEIRRAVDLAKQAAERGWWHAYELSAMHASYIALESEAAGKRVWENAFIPGLLQTEDYARAVIAAGPDPLTPERLEGLVAARMKRQKLLCREHPLLLHAIADEAVLCRPAGGREVMAAQLAHLAEAAQAPNVTFQVLPFAAGSHPGMGGPVAVLEYPGDDHDVVYVETQAGSAYVENDRDTARIYRAFTHLIAMSLSPRDTISLIARYAAGLR